MLNGFHNGEVENLLYLPEYKMYLAIDYDGVNVYDQYEKRERTMENISVAMLCMLILGISLRAYRVESDLV